jgi:17beta-estradiol 17-dehydrogenase / very-long-chain 3-oxoacyl-CoA reductase
LAKIGRRGGSIGYANSGSPYWSHALLAAFLTGVMGSMNGVVVNINRTMHEGIRKRALRKAEREKSQGKKTS